jgi:hypothetical protein
MTYKAVNYISDLNAMGEANWWEAMAWCRRVSDSSSSVINRKHCSVSMLGKQSVTHIQSALRKYWEGKGKNEAIIQANIPEKVDSFLQHFYTNSHFHCTLSLVAGMLSGRLLMCSSFSPTGVPDNPLLWSWLPVIRPMEEDTLPIILGTMALFITLEWPFSTPSVRKVLPRWHLPDTSELEETKAQTWPKVNAWFVYTTHFMKRWWQIHGILPFSLCHCWFLSQRKGVFFHLCHHFSNWERQIRL